MLFRQLTKHKLYSLINLFGLAVGLTCGILALLVIQHELSFDQMHQKSAETRRVEEPNLGQTAAGAANRVNHAVARLVQTAQQSIDVPDLERQVVQPRSP